MSTIKDVARRAGVAVSTVSAVINRSAPVSKQTVSRVEAAISDIGYTPHGGASSLRSGRSRLIGLVVPNIANPYFAAVAREIENACLNKGYTAVVYSTGQDPARESQVLTMMRMQRVGGLIIIPTRSDAAHGAALVNQIHVPTVLLDMFVEGLAYDVVKTDNVEAGRLATDHLLSLGHRRIGIILGIPGLATSDDRHAGYKKAHEERGLTYDARLAVNGDFDQLRAHAAVRKMLSGNDRPTAIVSISNMMSVGLLFAVREAGIKIPVDLSVVGIDDLELAGLLETKPTMVVTPILDMARRSIHKLLDQMNGDAHDAIGWEIFAPELVVRESTAKIDLKAGCRT